MSIQLQAVISQTQPGLRLIQQLSATAPCHHPPPCKGIKTFVCGCHCRHSKDGETDRKLSLLLTSDCNLSLSRQYVSRMLCWYHVCLEGIEVLFEPKRDFGLLDSRMISLLVLRKHNSIINRNKKM